MRSILPSDHWPSPLIWSEADIVLPLPFFLVERLLFYAGISFLSSPLSFLISVSRLRVVMTTDAIPLLIGRWRPTSHLVRR